MVVLLRAPFLNLLLNPLLKVFMQNPSNLLWGSLTPAAMEAAASSGASSVVHQLAEHGADLNLAAWLMLRSFRSILSLFWVYSSCFWGVFSYCVIGDAKHHIMSCHVMSCHVMSCHIISYHMHFQSYPYSIHIHIHIHINIHIHIKSSTYRALR